MSRMNVRFIFFKLSETWQANKLQSEPSKRQWISRAKLVVRHYGISLQDCIWSHEVMQLFTFYFDLLSFVCFFFFIPAMKPFDWLATKRANLLFCGASGKSSETTSMSYCATHITWCQLHLDSTTAGFIPPRWHRQTRVNIDICC